MPSTPAQRARARERAAAAKESTVRMEQAGTVPPLQEPHISPSEPPPNKPSNRVQRGKDKKKATGTVTPEAQAALHEVVIVAIAGASMFMPEALRPTSKDVDAIFIPAERIYLRHASIPEISPDATDAIACMMGVAGYLAHVKFPTIQRRQRSRQSEQNTGTEDSGPTVNPASYAGPSQDVPNGTGTVDNAASVLARLHNETFGRGAPPDEYN